MTDCFIRGMTMKSVTAFFTVVVLSVLMLATNAFAQTNAFSYQGSLSDSGGLADGLYDFQFDLYSASTGGTSLGSDEHLAVLVTDGLFSVDLDFGISAFANGTDRYLEIAVRFDGDPTYTTLDPRVMLGSVPFASHADRAGIADFASSGPFEPRDTTPESDSGTSRQTIFTLLDIDGTPFLNTEVVFPIRIVRNVQIMNGSVFLGQYLTFEIELTKPYDTQDQWEQEYENAVSPVEIFINTQNDSNVTEYRFLNGIVSGYALEQDRDLIERLTVTFDMTNTQLASRVTRDASGYTPGGPGTHVPFLGGSSVLPGMYRYEYDNATLQYSGVGVFPGEDRLISLGNPTNAIDARSVSLIMNVYEDRFNMLWNEFAATNLTNRLELHDNTASTIWVPTNPIAGISAWELDVADDTGLFETYEFTYSPNLP
jgi:hypothetical protein